MSTDKTNDLEGETTQELYADVLGPSEIDDVLIKFNDGNGTAFDVEFVDFENPPFRGFNVAGPLPTSTHGDDIADAVDLEVTDSHRDFVALESDANDAGVAVEELKEIVTAVGVSMDDMKVAKRRQIETGFWNELAGKVMNRLGMGRKA